jgi:hypothetical protein
MSKKRIASALFGTWAAASVLLGSALMSFHQPFRAPTETASARQQLLALLPTPASSSWRAIHILSASCRCSQSIMRHLLARYLANAAEQILVLDPDSPSLAPLPESTALLAALQQHGFSITHVAADSIPLSLGLHAVPFLVLASPSGEILYAGGYGISGDAGVALLAEAKAGSAPAALAILGCAASSTLQRRTDPLHLKF